MPARTDRPHLLSYQGTFGHVRRGYRHRCNNPLPRQHTAAPTTPAGCDTTDLSLLVDWHEAADACQLDALRTGCLVRLAHAVAAWGGELAPTLAQAAPLERCSPRTLARLLALVASAGARQRPAGQQLAIPTAAAVDAAIAEAASPQPFEWTLAAFSGQPAASGERVLSPTFKMAGGCCCSFIEDTAPCGPGNRTAAMQAAACIKLSLRLPFLCHCRAHVAAAIVPRRRHRGRRRLCER